VINVLSIYSGPTLLYSTETIPTSGNSMQCDLQMPLLLSAESIRGLRVKVDVRQFPSSNGFAMIVADATDIEARDNNSGELVTVAAPAGGAFPATGHTLVFQEEATGVAVAMQSSAPQTVLPSQPSVDLFSLTFAHTDTTLAASVVIDSLAFAFSDSVGSPAYPGDFFTRLLVISGADTITEISPLSGLSQFANCRLPQPIVIAPGGVDSVKIVAAARSLYVPAALRVRMEQAYVHAIDGNSGERILGVAGAFPMLTNLVHLRIQGGDITCALESRLPTNLTGSETALPAFDFVVTNNSPTGFTGANLIYFEVEAQNWKSQTIKPADLLGQAFLMRADTVFLAGVSSDANISFAVPPGKFGISAGESQSFSFVVDLKPGIENESFRFILSSSSAASFVDDATGDPIANDDAAFPMATSFTHVLGTDIEKSFTNYPNPFAAGRESTNITYYLAEPARVTLKLLTAWGAPVATLLERVRQTPGLQQSTHWDGLNDDGNAVNNGVYYLVLEVDGDSGDSYEIRRKVGVVR